MLEKSDSVSDELSEVMFALSDSPSVVPENLAGRMSEPQKWVATLAGERKWGDNRESWFARAAENSGVPYRMIRAIFHGEVTDRSHWAMVKLKDAAERAEVESMALQFERCARWLREKLALRG